MSGKKEKAKLVPPYIPWRTFITFIDGLRPGVPSRIDRSVMRTFSGAAQSGLLATLRYLDLTDDDGVPTGNLTALVHSQEAERQQLLRNLLEGAYPFLFEEGFSLETSTGAHFTEQFSKSGTTGDTTRKAAAFFLAAAKEAGISLSKYVTPTRGPKVANTKKAIRKTTPKKAEKGGTPGGEERPPARLSWARELLSKFPGFDPQWPDEVKAKWFDDFKMLMEMEQES